MRRVGRCSGRAGDSCRRDHHSGRFRGQRRQAAPLSRRSTSRVGAHVSSGTAPGGPRGLPGGTHCTNVRWTIFALEKALMKTLAGFASAAALVSMLAAPLAFAADTKADAFIQKAIEGNLAEI